MASFTGFDEQFIPSKHTGFVSQNVQRRGVVQGSKDMLRDKQIKAGLTQEEFSNLTDTTTRTIQTCEQGKGV